MNSIKQKLKEENRMSTYLILLALAAFFLSALLSPEELVENKNPCDPEEICNGIYDSR